MSLNANQSFYLQQNIKRSIYNILLKYQIPYMIEGGQKTEIEEESLRQGLKVANYLNLSDYSHARIFDGINYPWQVLPFIAKYAQEFISTCAQEERQKGTVVGSVFIEDNVIIGEGTVIEHGAMIKGPTIIGKNCQIRKGAYFRGNVIIGDNCVIGNSVELKNSVLLNKAQVCHFNYVGDSVLGEGAHLAAGAITSNLKLDQKQVIVRNKKESFPTELKKFGAVVGDYCEVGCNVVLNPGTILGRRCVIYPGASVRGVIPMDHIVKLTQQQIIIAKQ